MYYYFALGVATIFGIWTIGSYLAIRNLEEPAHTVIVQKDGYEIREYSPYIIAQTTVSGTYQQALNEGFRRIADYIFGNNTSQSSIAMTAPVLENQSQKIAMTVPVTTSLEPTKDRVVSFVMPTKYNLETLPSPNSSAVTLREVPSQTVAALQFNWYATESRVEKHKQILEKYLNRDSVTITGATQVAQYNPPLSIPITRRNEILIPISNE